MPAPVHEINPVWQSYIDLNNDIKPYLQFPAGASPQDQELQNVIDAACWWAQDTLGRPIAPTTFFRRFSGWAGLNGAYVQLPYYPVLSVTSVVEWWGLSGPHTLAEQTPANQSSQDAYQLDALRGTIIRTFMGLVQRPFFPGSRNIEITWTAGCNPIPRHWIMATKELVKYWWANTQQSSRSFQAKGEYDEPVGAYGLWPAVPDRVSMMFQTAIQIGIG